MEIGSKVLQYSSWLFSAVQIIQSFVLYKNNSELDYGCHEEETKLSIQHQEEDIKSMKQTYLMNSFTDMEKHFQQLNADLINATKETEKDMVDQRTLWCQTIIVACTLMITSIIGVLIQGTLPGEDLGNFIYLSYSISNAGSMGFLFLCTIIYVEIVHRISKFNIKRTRKYSSLLSDVIYKTKTLLSDIRTHNISHEEKGEEIKFDDIPNEKKIKKQQRKSLSKLSPLEFDNEWHSHEELIYKYLHERDVINDNTARIFSSEQGFEKFWSDYCENLSNKALFFFYMGTGFMLVAMMVFMWVIFKVKYSCILGSYITVSITGLSLIIGFSVVIAQRTHVI